MTDKRETLEKTRLNALNHIRNVLPLIEALGEELEELQREHKDYKKQYEEADRALAENDGRLSTVPTGMRGKKPMQLTLDQVRNIANKLGVKL